MQAEEQIEQEFIKKVSIGIPANLFCIDAFCELPDEESRFASHCISVSISDGKFELATTDGRVLAIASGECPMHEPWQGVVRSCDIDALISSQLNQCEHEKARRRRLRKMSFAFRNLFSETEIRCAIDGKEVCRISAPRVEKRFPRYREISPIPPVTHRVSVDPALMKLALETAGAFAEDNSVVIEWRGEFDPLTIRPYRCNESEKPIEILLMPTAPDNHKRELSNEQ